MPEKYVRREGLPILLRHTGRTSLPDQPPELSARRPARTIEPPQPEPPPVVCLHDAGLQSSVFVHLLSAIESKGGAAIAFDLPGHGRSGSLDALPSIGAMAEMAAWVIDWCGLRDAVLVGHGMGALVALEVAKQSPLRVEKFVLCGLGALLSISDESIETMRKVTRGKAPRPFDPKRVAQASGQDGMRAAYMEGIKTDPRATLVDLESCRDYCRDRLAARLHESGVTSKTVLARGDAELELGQADAFRGCIGESVAARVATLAATRIDGAAHFLPLEQPAALADVVLGEVAR